MVLATRIVMKRIFLLIILATSCFFLVRATDYYVNATVGNNTNDGSSVSPWKTITYGLGQITGTGHTLYVAAGTYNPTLGETFPILMKDGVSLVGAGIDISIIDANSTNTVIRCVSILDSITKIEGFTIRDGYNTTSSGGGIYISAGSVLKIMNNKITDNHTDVSCDGGGIYVNNSSPTILNNIVSENSSGQADGGGIYIENGSPLIMGNNITLNSSDYDGAVYIYGSSSSPRIVNNIISMNTKGGIECYEAGNPRIINNTIFGNTGSGGNLYGYGIRITSSSPDIINNTISDNIKEGIYISSGTPDSIFNNIFSLNGGYGIYENGTTIDPGKVWYNLFYANGSGLYRDEGTTDYYTAGTLNTGVAECENNIDGDPMFVDRINGDYKLRQGSPAIDAGDPSSQFNDPDGSRNDIGAFAFDKPPAIPQNLSATAGAGEVTLRWNPNIEPDLDQYNIYRDLLSPATTLVDSVISTSPPDTFYVDTGLIIGQDYFYRITALDTEQNESDFSDEISAVIPFDLYTDSLALVALYDSTDGANWTNNTNWLTGPVSTWYGVTVSGNRVTQIDLKNNNLVGTIPSEIGNLTNLTNLSLFDNNLSGSIPTEIGNLINLTDLNFHGNNLSGSIPTEIGNLTNLTYLDLFINQLSGSVPIEIGNLTNLTVLYLFSNQLSGSIPTEIGNLTNLGNLDFHDNQLTGSIPTEIGNLINLIFLDFSSNQLAGSIPAEIGNLTYLEQGLSLWNNQLTGSIPTEIGNLTSLQNLELNDNQLSGYIPAAIGNLTYLKTFCLHNNQFTDLPNLASLDSLDDLKIQNNQFTFKDIEPNIGVASTTYTYSPQDSVGEIIDTTVYTGTSYTMYVSTGGTSSQYQWKKDGTNIGTVSIDSTYTLNPVAFPDSGTYTCEITNTVATDLTLNSRPVNVFVDYTPLQKDSLVLVALYDSTDGANWTDKTNWLTGPVSTWYGITVSGDRVTQIDLKNNNLVGTIPSEIGNLTNLTNLSLFDNNLSGSIPTEIGNLINLTDLNFHGNNLSGSIPTEIGNLTNLTYLDLFINQLSGSVPIEIGNLTNLTVLYLFSNQLSGSIPTEIGNLTNLGNLDFHDNQLTGSIPTEIGNLINLIFLDFSSNQLAGSIPAEIGNLTYLEQGLSLWNNQLTGSIPTEIGNLTSLQNLELNDNQLSGYIPAAIGNLTYLKTFCLHNNQFTDLPNLASLDSLDDLKIQNNQFTFKDIEPNIGVASTTYTYSPQDSVGELIDTTVYVGTSYTISVSTGGASSRYQWKKDGTNIGSISIDSTYTLNPVAFSDTGAYTCEITNTVATDLTLYSRPVNVSVPSVLNSENDILSFSFAEQTGEATIDDVNNTVDIDVVYGTNLANLVATFSISSQASITINSVDQVSGVTVNNFTNPVIYTVTAEDESTQDWIITVSEAGILIISDFPYSENFESGNGGWRTGGTNSSWEHGIPSAGQTINSAASETNAWVTNLTGDYNPDEVSYVTSPQFDLSSLNFPKIEFSIWWYSEGFYDGANLQYKQGTDPWKTLRTNEDDNSWYNSSYIYSIEKGFGFDLNSSAGWSGDNEWGYGSNGWVTVSHALTGIINQPIVTFRIAFASNSGYENDGIAFDDIYISDDPTGIDPVETGLSDIQIYPNPNEGKFRLVYNGERDIDLKLQLINLQGQVILSEQIEAGHRFSKEFELDYLSAGIYYFRLMNREGVVVKKMVVR